MGVAWGSCWQDACALHRCDKKPRRACDSNAYCLELGRCDETDYGLGSSKSEYPKQRKERRGNLCHDMSYRLNVVLPQACVAIGLARRVSHSHGSHVFASNQIAHVSSLRRGHVLICPL
jgi:hypothetical protein